MKKIYVLTDGHEVAETKEMTFEEYQDAQHNSVRATDGNWYWAEKKDFDNRDK